MVAKLPIEMPELKEFLKAGVQFGHEAKRWNPKMKKYILTAKNKVHIIDLIQTIDLLEKALRFLIDVSRKGPVMFVGTKRQASEIIKENAIKSGSYFVDNRWPGGLLTNFNTIKQSLRKLKTLEEDFSTGIEGRTKYEISKMKVKWSRLNRLYSGIKTMQRYPVAMVVVDPRYEIGAVVEARKLGIPIVGITDSNCNPDVIDYIVPGNDDSIKSLNLIIELFRKAVSIGNGGQGIKHDIKDYSKFEVKIIKKLDEKQESKTESKKPQKTRFRIKSKINTKSKIETNVKDKPKESSEIENPKKENKEILSSRVSKTLEKLKIKLEDTKKMNDEELQAVKGLGQKAIEEIRKVTNSTK